MKKGQKLLIISNIVTVICGIVALILLLIGGVDFKNPIIWFVCLIVVSSNSSLISQLANTKKKKK